MLLTIPKIWNSFSRKERELFYDLETLSHRAPEL